MPSEQKNKNKAFTVNQKVRFRLVKGHHSEIKANPSLLERGSLFRHHHNQINAFLFPVFIIPNLTVLHIIIAKTKEIYICFINRKTIKTWVHSLNF